MTSTYYADFGEQHVYMANQEMRKITLILQGTDSQGFFALGDRGRLSCTTLGLLHELVAVSRCFQRGFRVAGTQTLRCAVLFARC